LRLIRFWITAHVNFNFLPIVLDKVWTVDRLPISKRSVPSDKDVSQWPHLKGIKFPRLDGEEKAVNILIEMMCLKRIRSMKRDVEDENSHIQLEPPLVGRLLGA